MNNRKFESKDSCTYLRNSLMLVECCTTDFPCSVCKEGYWDCGTYRSAHISWTWALVPLKKSLYPLLVLPQILSSTSPQPLSSSPQSLLIDSSVFQPLKCIVNYLTDTHLTKVQSNPIKSQTLISNTAKPLNYTVNTPNQMRQFQSYNYSKNDLSTKSTFKNVET